MTPPRQRAAHPPQAVDAGRRRLCGGGFLASTLAMGIPAFVQAQATADPVQTLRVFVRTVQSGRAAFTQTVISPDGAKRKTSSGQFDFARPNRFRFAYQKPFEQLIVADGEKVWIHDPDLQQASSRSLKQALASTPAALLAGGEIDSDFELSALPPSDGVDWVQARPRQSGGSVLLLRVGFRAGQLARLDIEDSFGQKSQIVFAGFEANVAHPADRFRFVPPPGTDVIAQ